jgi:integrase/recombinase XerD
MPENAVEILPNPLVEADNDRVQPRPIAKPRIQATSDGQLVELWLHSRPASTQRAYRADAARFREFVRKELRQVTLGHLQTFAASLGSLGEATRYRCLSAVKSLFAFGHLLGYFPFDVGRVLRLPAVRNRLAERILPETDLHRMLSLEPDERNRLVLYLLYAAGVRRAELAGLRWRDLQAAGDGGQITVFGKGGKTRSIQLPPSLWKQLLALRGAGKNEQPVFPSRKGGAPLTDSGIWRIVKKAAKRAGLSPAVSPHWLRHGHASHALDRGAPSHLVQATLGHASVATTGRYLHARPKESSSRYLGL